MTKLQHLFQAYQRADKCHCESHALEVPDEKVCQKEKMWRAYCRMRDACVLPEDKKMKLSRKETFSIFGTADDD